MSELHVVPQFYGVYILQSVPKPKAFYIGSSPNPRRRLLQHNGSNIGGAYRTKRNGYRPWKMVVVVHGFTSNIAALQFEHGLQHPYKTRHIKNKISQSRLSGTSIHFKLANIRLLLSCPLFKTMGLSVSILDKETLSIWNKNKFNIPTETCVTSSSFDDFINTHVKPNSAVSQASQAYVSVDDSQPNANINRDQHCILQLQTLSQPELDTEPNLNVDDVFVSKPETQEIAHDTSSEPFELIKHKVLFEYHNCCICDNKIDYLQDVPSITSKADLDATCKTIPLIALCKGCQNIYHLTCLAKTSSLLIPILVSCECGSKLLWKQLVETATLLRWYILKDCMQKTN